MGRSIREGLGEECHAMKSIPSLLFRSDHFNSKQPHIHFTHFLHPIVPPHHSFIQQTPLHKKIHSISPPNRDIVAPRHSIIPAIAASSIPTSSIPASSISSIRRKRIAFQLGRHVLMGFSQHFDEFLPAHRLPPFLRV